MALAMAGKKAAVTPATQSRACCRARASIFTVLNQVDYDNYMGRKYYKSYSKYGKYGYYKKYYKRSHEAEKK